MNKKSGSDIRKIFWIILAIVAATVLITWQITYNYVKRTMSEQYTQVLSQITATNDISRVMYNVDTAVKSKYIGEVDENKMIDYTINGYIHGLGDKYASYMSAEEYADYLLFDKSGARNVGLGLTCVYDSDADGLYVLNVYDGTPAYRSGIIPGEIITRVAGTPVTEVSFSLAVDTISNGIIGNTIDITVKSLEGVERAMTLVYEETDLNTIAYKMLNNDTGLIKISAFSDGTSKDFQNAIQKLTVRGADRFVIDIRNNAGGKAEIVAEMLDFLLPSGKTVVISHKNGMFTESVSDEDAFSAPISLVINKNTAGEAEVFAVALKEYGKAVLVGDNTYGKSYIQEVVNLPEGGAASISVSSYLSPNGVSFEGIGIVPDISASLSDDQLQKLHLITEDQDLQLQEAITAVKNMEVTTIK